MAVAASQVRVLPGQIETHVRVREVHIRPTGSHMAGSAVVTQSPRMGIVFGVAANATRRSISQIFDCPRPGMAISTRQRRMRRHEREPCGRVVEVRAKGLQAIVTVEAC